MSNGASVLLLVANGRVGYRVLRCAAEADMVEQVIVLGSHGESYWSTRGLKASRFCAEFVAMSRPFADPRAIAEVNSVAARYAHAVIAPADLVTTRFIAASAGQLAAPCVLTPSLHALDLLARKDAFAAFCQAADLPHPPTAVAANLDEAQRLVARRPSGSLAVIKPVAGMAGAGVRIVSVDEPDWRGLDYQPILIQDYVPGSDLSASAFGEGGRLVAFLAYRNETRPILGKSRRIAVNFFEAPQLQAMVAEVAARTSLSGIVNFDARLSLDGELILIECNPRPWYTMQFATLAGRNFASLWFDEALRRRGLPAVVGSVTTFPGGPLSGAGFAWSHVRHILRDPVYYLAVDAWHDVWRRSARRARRNPWLD